MLWDQANFAKIRAMGLSAAYWIANGGVNRQVEVRAIRIEGIRGANLQFIASLPPAMLADNNAWIDLFVKTRAGAHSAGWGAYINPIAILDSPGCRSHGVQFDLRVHRALA